MSDVSTIDPPETSTDSNNAQNEMLLLFKLSDEVFAISVMRVSEIIDPIPRTEVPNADPFAPAIINVRGAIVPLLDVRQRLRIPAARRQVDTRIVVIEMALDGVPTKMAILADAVTEVIAADMNALERVPELGARWPKKYVKGVVRHNDELVILLETETLFLADFAQDQTA